MSHLFVVPIHKADKILFIKSFDRDSGLVIKAIDKVCIFAEAFCRLLHKTVEQ